MSTIEDLEARVIADEIERAFADALGFGELHERTVQIRDKLTLETPLDLRDAQVVAVVLAPLRAFDINDLVTKHAASHGWQHLVAWCRDWKARTTWDDGEDGFIVIGGVPIARSQWNLLVREAGIVVTVNQNGTRIDLDSDGGSVPGMPGILEALEGSFVEKPRAIPGAHPDYLRHDPTKRFDRRRRQKFRRQGTRP